MNTSGCSAQTCGIHPLSYSNSCAVQDILPWLDWVTFHQKNTERNMIRCPHDTWNQDGVRWDGLWPSAIWNKPYFKYGEIIVGQT